ncbi:PKD domain-containing protein [Candidatus Bathyarchaeota archaeon]|nr:PKD domain-containing protein [Candidatus Bathyarchaeota archaeon]
MRVTDKRGSVGIDTLKVTVRNVSPIVEAGVDQTANEGTQVSFSGSFSDLGADSHTIVWDFGDGSIAEGTLTPTHTYVDNGVFTVRLTVTDDDGGAGDDTIIVTVNNVAPTVEAGSDLTIEEGSEIIFAGSFIDPGIVDSHTIIWDFGDGQSVYGTLTPSHTYIENGMYTVTLSVTDKDGGTGIDSLTVTVNNAAPTVEAGQDQAPNEGSSVSFLGSFTDPGLLDTHTIIWNFGDGTIASETLNPTHTYLDNGIYMVTLTVTDDDGAIGTDALTVTVNNVAPEVEAGADQTVDEATEVSFSGSFIDPGLDTHIILWDFGDGATAAGTLNPTHIYTDNGVYAVTLTVVDDDGDEGKDSLTVTVENFAPIVDAGLGIEVFAGDPVTISGIFVDAGWLDTHTATCDFGDGTIEYCIVTEENEYPDSTGTVSVSHTYYSAGIYTVALKVLDDESAEGTDTLKITVKAILAKITIDPDTLNLKSEGKWITAYIDLAESYCESQVDPSTVKVWVNSKSFVAEKAYLQDGILMVKFSRTAISDHLKAQGISSGEIQFTITGKVLYNDGLADFEGFDTVRIISNGKGK